MLRTVCSLFNHDYSKKIFDGIPDPHPPKKHKKAFADTLMKLRPKSRLILNGRSAKNKYQVIKDLLTAYKMGYHNPANFCASTYTEKCVTQFSLISAPFVWKNAAASH